MQHGEFGDGLLALVHGQQSSGTPHRVAHTLSTRVQHIEHAQLAGQLRSINAPLSEPVSSLVREHDEVLSAASPLGPAEHELVHERSHRGVLLGAREHGRVLGLLHTLRVGVPRLWVSDTEQESRQEARLDILDVQLRRQRLGDAYTQEVEDDFLVLGLGLGSRLLVSSAPLRGKPTVVHRGHSLLRASHVRLLRHLFEEAVNLVPVGERHLVSALAQQRVQALRGEVTANVDHVLDTLLPGAKNLLEAVERGRLARIGRRS